MIRQYNDRSSYRRYNRHNWNKPLMKSGIIEKGDARSQSNSILKVT